MINRQDSCRSEDIDLMLKVAQGDGRAYDELYRRHFGNLVRFIGSLEGRARSREDLAQEVFLRIWRNRRKYRPNAAFRTYLFACAKNVVREHEAKARRENLLISRASCRILSSCPPEGDAALATEDLIAVLRKLLAVLPHRQGRIVELIHIRGLSPKTAARMLRCTVHSVHTNLYRAKKNLRKLAAAPAEEG